MKKLLLISGLWLLAASMAGAAVSAIQAVDVGGQRASSTHYTADQSLGGIVGISAVASPLETARHGYIGQLTEAVDFTVLMETNAVDEGDSQQLSGVATLDDDTALALEGSEVAWDAAVFPLLSISNSGLATTTNVYEDTTAFVTGLYLNIEGTESFLVRNVNDDDFGSYAGDGLPDGWQVGYFGIGSADAGPTNNVDEDPFDNEGEWIADTIPTDSNSYFFLTFISNAIPDDIAVAFESSSSRVYSLEVSTNLMVFDEHFDWMPVSGQTNLPGTDSERWLTDSNVPVAGHYRVTVGVP